MRTLKAWWRFSCAIVAWPRRGMGQRHTYLDLSREPGFDSPPPAQAGCWRWRESPCDSRDGSSARRNGCWRGSECWGWGGSAWGQHSDAGKVRPVRQGQGRRAGGSQVMCTLQARELLRQGVSAPSRGPPPTFFRLAEEISGTHVGPDCEQMPEGGLEGSQENVPGRSARSQSEAPEPTSPR